MKMSPNNAIDSDTVRSPLRAPYGARHRERWADDGSCTRTIRLAAGPFSYPIAHWRPPPVRLVAACRVTAVSRRHSDGLGSAAQLPALAIELEGE